ncbi:MAG: hypothetical protein AAFN10_07145 [Bacteroidota bacterium]
MPGQVSVLPKHFQKFFHGFAERFSVPALLRILFKPPALPIVIGTLSAHLDRPPF